MLTICYRDLVTHPVSHINQQWITADKKVSTARTIDDRETLKTSDILIKGLRTADVIVFAAPIYNWFTKRLKSLYGSGA
jgi:FMN-dependent NADH-azoreductase